MALQGFSAVWSTRVVQKKATHLSEHAVDRLRVNCFESPSNLKHPYIVAYRKFHSKGLFSLKNLMGVYGGEVLCLFRDLNEAPVEATAAAKPKILNLGSATPNPQPEITT